MHRILLREAVIDVPAESFAASCDFWAAALDTEARTVTEYPEFVGLERPAALMHVGLQQLQAGTPRVHLDIETDDVDAEVERLKGLGAEHVEQGRAWVVLRDPSGLVFCVTPPDTPEFDSRAREVH